MDENSSAGHPLAHEQEDLLRELVIRLTSYPGDPTLRNPQLLVGKLPENLPVTLPIPEKSHVLGTLMPSPQSLQVVLDVPLSEQEVFDLSAPSHRNGQSCTDVCCSVPIVPDFSS